MNKGQVLLGVCILCLASLYALAADNLHWLLAFKGQPTSTIISDKKFRDFIDASVPDFQADFGFNGRGLKTGLKSALMEVLSGPSDPAIFPDDHTVVLSACRFQSCAEKGFLWIDTNQQTSVMAIIHYVYEGEFHDKAQLFLSSNDFKCGAYPKEAAEYLKLWLRTNDITPANTRCLDDKKVIETSLN